MERIDQTSPHHLEEVVGDCQGRCAVELALRASEERYRKLVELSPDAIFVNRNGQLNYVNRACLQLFGATASQQLLGKTPFELFHPDCHCKIQARLDNLLEHDAPAPRIELKIVRLDGSSVDVEVSSVAMHDEEGWAVQALIRDITGQRQTEETLRQHNAYLDALYDTTLGLLNRLEINNLLQVILARASALLAASGGFLCLYNAEQDTMEMKVASGPGGHLKGIHFARNEGLAGRVWASGRPLTVKRYANRDGRLHLRELDSIQAMTGVPLLVDDTVIGVLGLNRQEEDLFTEAEVEILNRFGQLAALALKNSRLFTAAQQEIEERRRVEAALQQSELRLRRLVEHLPAGAAYVDGNKLFMNKAAEDITGYARSELPDLDHWFQQLYPADCKALRAHYELARKTNFGPPQVWNVTQKDGTVRQVEITPFREGVIEVWLLRDVTDSERLARLMAQAESAASIGGWEVDCRTNKIYWTPESYRILSESLPNILESPMIHPEFYHPDDYQRFNAAIIAAMQYGEPFDLELEHIDPSRSPIWIRITGRAECLDGKPAKIYGSLQDITKRKRIEEALRTSEEKYRALLETTNTGYCLIDERGRLLDANTAYVRLTGYGSLAEILGRNVLDWTASYDLARNAESIRQCLAAGFVRDLQLDYVNRNGQSTPVEISATVLQADGGVRLLALCRNITQRRQAEAALRESEARFRQLAEHIDEAFWLADSQQVLYISPAYEKMWGLTVAQVSQNPWAWLEAVHPADRARVHTASVTKTLRGEYDEQYRVISPDGTVRWIHDRAFPIRDERGEFQRIAGVAKDITPQRRQEEAQQSLIECSRVTGQDFFTTMVQTLATVLKARHVLICELPKDLPGMARTIAYSANGALVENFAYRLENTPCADIIHQHTCFFRRDVAALFPEDLLLAELDIESYLGTALRGSSGEILGMLIVMHDSTLDETMQPATILEIFAGRAASELEREAAVRHIHRLNAELEQRVRERTVQLEMANEAVRMSESRQRAMLTAIPDLVFRLNRAGEFLDFSTTSVNTLIPVDKIVGSNIRDVPLAPEVIERSLTAYQLAIDTNEIQTIEYRVDSPKNTQHFESRIVRSGPDEVISIVRNITNRVQAEAALRESEERFRSIFEQAAVGIAHVHTDGRFLLVNQKLCNILGYSRQELMSLTVVDITHEDDLEISIISAEKLTIQEMDTFSLEKRYRRQDGSYVWVNMTSSLGRQPDGQNPYFINIVEDISQRKLAEEAQQASEEKLRRTETRQRALLSAMPDTMFRMNRDGVYLDASTSRATSKRPPEMLIGSNVRDWSFPIQTVEKILAAIDRALATSDMQTIEYTLSDKSPLEFREARIVRSDDDEVVIIVRNVTERKQAEEALRHSEQRLRQIIDLVPHWIFAKDVDGRYILANKALADANNTTVDELLGKCDADFGWSLDEIEQFREDDIEVLQSGRSKSITAERTMDFAGRQLVLHTIKIPFTFSGATTPSVLGVSTDITELKRIEESLRMSEARQRALLSAIPDAMMRINSAGTCLDVSDPQGIIGAPPEKLIGSAVRASPLPSTLIEQSAAAHERALSTGEIQTIEYSYASPLAMHHYECRIVRSSADEAVVILRDITERKLIELRVRQLNEELEDRVRQRTAELEVANRELESFSYSVSHDLRVPLRAINGFSQALVEDYGHLLDEDAHNYVARVRAASQRMGILIDDLLNLSRVTRHEIHPTTVDLSAVAGDIAADLHAANSSRQVSFVIAPDLFAEADPNLIHIVLENLLSNAWKYTGKHPTARIELGAFQQDGTYIYFVKDDGAGFDMTYANKLFRAFQRLHSENEFVGTGIGLATVERIIRRHGGRVWAEGKVEAGATFYFTLS